jgi:hypothetical protein
MAARSRLLIADAERRFPVRIRIALPEDGLGERLEEIQRWLDDTCGGAGWAMTPSGTSVANDAIAIYFSDAAIASAFVARWCAGHRVETTAGLFRVRDDAPAPRHPSALHRTP